MRPGSRSLRAGAAMAAAALIACAPISWARAQQGANSNPGTTPPSTEGVARLDAEALLVRGLTQARLGKLDLALASLSSALQLAPEEGAILSAVSGLYVRLGDLESAEYYARRAYDLEPRLEYGQALADVLNASGKTLLLNAIRDDLEKRFPDAPHLSDALAEPSETNRPLAGERANESIGTLAEATVLLDTGRVGEAIAVFERLVAEDIRVEANWVGLASSQYQSGNAALAARTAQEGLVLFPGSTSLLIQSARSVLVEGAPDEAERIRQAMEAVAHEKSAEEAAELFAFAALVAGIQRRSPSDLLDRALTLDSANRLAIGEVARRAADAGDKEGARRRLASLPPIRADDWEAAEAAGHAYLALGDPESAWRLFGTALRTPYPNALLIEAATDASRQAGESVAARSLLEEARARQHRYHETSGRNKK